MPVMPAPQLQKLLTRLYVAVGVSAEESSTVAGYQVQANLAGHDSHGCARTPEYIELIEAGRVVPGAPFEVVSERPGTAVIDGHWGFGFVVTERATKLAIHKARSGGVCVITVRRQGHIGRLGSYTTRAAQEGMAALLVADSGRGPKAVAPFGGSDRRLGTNPLSLALPAEREGHVTLDMATTAVAGGKVRLAHTRGERVPEGWLVDADGNPTTDPAAYFQGGALLPLGGDQGHKGYGLSFMIEALASVLPGIGFGADPAGFPNDGVFLLVVAIDHFRDLEEFRREMSDFVAYVKASPPARDGHEVLYPGELEQRNFAQRSVEGIPIPEEVLQALREVGTRRGLSL